MIRMMTDCSSERMEVRRQYHDIFKVQKGKITYQAWIQRVVRISFKRGPAIMRPFLDEWKLTDFIVNRSILGEM